MRKLLKDLYDCFYTPPELSAERWEVEECHQPLIKAPEKSERRSVLCIIDAKDHIITDTSMGYNMDLVVTEPHTKCPANVKVFMLFPNGLPILILISD